MSREAYIHTYIYIYNNTKRNYLCLYDMLNYKSFIDTADGNG